MPKNDSEGATTAAAAVSSLDLLPERAPLCQLAFASRRLAEHHIAAAHQRTQTQWALSRICTSILFPQGHSTRKVNPTVSMG